MTRPQDRVGQGVRGTHPWHYRSGEWARVVAVMHDPERDRWSYLVEFPDLATDHWPVSDPDQTYEFRT